MTNPTHSSNALLIAALSYAKRGWPVLPLYEVEGGACSCGETECSTPGKHPLGALVPHGLKDASSDLKVVTDWWSRWVPANIGIVTGTAAGIVVLDIDPRHHGDKTFQTLQAELGPLPPTLMSHTGGGGSHLFFYTRGIEYRSRANALGSGVDVRAEGAYIAAPPSNHVSGGVYRWANDLPIADLPDLWQKRMLRQVSPKRNGNRNTGKIPQGSRNARLASLAGSMRRRGMSVEAIRAALWAENLERCEPRLSDGDVERIARSVGRYPPAPSESEPKHAPATPDNEPVIVGSGREDTANATRFVRQHGDVVRFWHGRGKWLLWTGTHWNDDALAEVVERAKDTAKQIYVEASGLPDNEAKALARWAERSLNRDKLTAMLALAASDPVIATNTETWDQDPFALNFLNGTVDVRTGELRPHSKADHMTKVVLCDYNPKIVGPHWERFVVQTFGTTLVPFMQKAVGYSLTAITSEKVAFLLVGPTNTGKSTFLVTLRNVFADYSSLIQIDTLMASKTPDNNTSADLADLRGARLVITSETEEGQRLREAKLKRITQGMGHIKTAKKYENPLEFPETHKLWMDCNHIPIIRGSDDAIWNRVIPIPCTHRVAEESQDRSLKDKLSREAEAIVVWTVAGAMRWHKEGLGRPDIIVETRTKWRDDMDVIGQFVTEGCTPEGSARAGELYQAFSEWSKKQGHERVMTATAFGLRMVERGFEKERDRQGWFYLGISLNGGLFQ